MNIFGIRGNETLLIVSNTKYLQQYNTPYQVWYIQYAIWWGEIGVMTWWRHRNICEHVWSAKCQALFAVSLQQNQSMKQSPTVHSTIHHVTAWAHESHKTVTHDTWPDDTITLLCWTRTSPQLHLPFGDKLLLVIVGNSSGLFLQYEAMYLVVY